MDVLPRHPGPGPRSFTPGQLSIEFVNVGGFLTSGDLALDSCAQFLAIAEHRPNPLELGQFVTNSVGLVISLFGLRLARIKLLMVMLGLGWLVLLVPPCLSHLLSLLSFRSFYGWVVY